MGSVCLATLRDRPADFGVARAIWSDATVTAGTLVAGTPAYLAAEVARGGERTSASGVFSSPDTEP